MATARSLNGARRHRPSAVPFPLLWLAALLLGVLVAHGARAESPEVRPVSAVPVAAAAAAGPGTWLAPEDAGPTEPRHHPGGHHSDEFCLAGQPQQGGPVASPCARPLTGPTRPAPVPVRFGRLPGTSAALPPPSGAPASVVRQV
ncbi:hypothetical protein [Streptomyces bugieae]|uniref:Secreted protein n=1 Tax=Streptomyces bugieae TaxID=3098223 RepID=A0ABU7NVA1_9ACTN|nr:hypothetical protein [Streptomyces sp. DSM 41528]